MENLKPTPTTKTWNIYSFLASNVMHVSPEKHPGGRVSFIFHDFFDFSSFFQIYFFLQFFFVIDKDFIWRTRMKVIPINQKANKIDDMD